MSDCLLPLKSNSAHAMNLFRDPLRCVLVVVTIARAIELKHAPGLIAALAYETANFYQKAGKLMILFYF